MCGLIFKFKLIKSICGEWNGKTQAIILLERKIDDNGTKDGHVIRTWTEIETERVLNGTETVTRDTKDNKDI